MRPRARRGTPPAWDLNRASRRGAAGGAPATYPPRHQLHMRRRRLGGAADSGSSGSSDSDALSEEEYEKEAGAAGQEGLERADLVVGASPAPLPQQAPHRRGFDVGLPLQATSRTVHIPAGRARRRRYHHTRRRRCARPLAPPRP